MKPDIAKLPPLYYPYDPYSEKLQRVSSYTNLKKSSYIRIGTNDFADFKPEQKNIYVADIDFCSQPAAQDFLKEYNNYRILSFWPLLVTEENLEDFLKYPNLLNRNLVIKNFSVKFFLEHFSLKNVTFSFLRWPQETSNEFYKRILSMGLAYKSRGLTIYVDPTLETPNNELTNFIRDWLRSKETVSFKEFYSNNAQIQKEILH